MAHQKKVFRSIETTDGTRCVDIFMRPDATFGFEEYRRDVEDSRWFPIGSNPDRIYGTEGAALDEAMSIVPWLRDAVHRINL